MFKIDTSKQRIENQKVKPNKFHYFWLLTLIVFVGILVLMSYNQTDEKRFNQLKQKLDNNENLDINEMNEFCDLLAKIRKIYVENCEDITLLKLAVDVQNFVFYEKGSEKLIYEILETDEKGFHLLKKKLIGQYYDQLSQIPNMQNPDIGFHKKTNTLLFRKTKSQNPIFITKEQY